MGHGRDARRTSLQPIHNLVYSSLVGTSMMGNTRRVAPIGVVTGRSAVSLRATFTRAVTIALAIAGTTAAWSPPAHAADSGQVRTLAGPETSNADLHLTYVSCDSFFTPGVAPQSRLNLGPFTAPLGRRSLGLVPAGPGTATGPFARFDSLSGLDASVAVTGSSGVSYVWTVTSDTPAGATWSGRAVVTPAAGAWTRVDAASLSYEWTLVDLASRASLGAGEKATPGQFAVTHGDGAGFVVTGFGCDGASFNLDAVSADGVAYDFEGIALQTSIATTTDQARPNDTIEVTGTVRDGSGRITGDPLVLEARAPGGAWAPVGPSVLADASGVARAVAPVTGTTEFRWHRPESQYADEGWSEIVTVTVAAPAPDPTTAPDPTAAPDPATAPDSTTAPDKKAAPDKK